MFWFKKMIETVNQNGIIDLNRQKVDTTNFFEAVEKCHSFVFSSKNVKDEQLKDLEENNKSIDLPFPTISIEIIGNGVFTSSHGSDIIENGGNNIHTACVLISENVNTKNLTAYVLCFSNHIFNLTQKKYVVFEITSQTDPNFSLVDHYLKRIYQEQEGLEKTRQKIKIGSGKTKRFHTIRKIIHIRPKSKKSYDKDVYDGKTIDFSHRFVRRGHWRYLDQNKFYKNREGDLTELGRTWVNDSKPIGPEDKPLIKKVRVVEN